VQYDEVELNPKLSEAEDKLKECFEPECDKEALMNELYYTLPYKTQYSYLMNVKVKNEKLTSRPLKYNEGQIFAYPNSSYFTQPTSEGGISKHIMNHVLDFDPEAKSAPKLKIEPPQVHFPMA
jgi:hypothetical protein